MGAGAVSKELELGAQTGTGGPLHGWRIHQARRRPDAPSPLLAGALAAVGSAAAATGAAASAGAGSASAAAGPTPAASGSGANVSAMDEAGVWDEDSATGAASAVGTCSVLVYEKSSSGGINAGVEDTLLEALRRDGQALSRLRHPLVLGVSKLEETPRALLLQTSEPVLCSLANVLRGQQPDVAALLRAPLAAKLALAELADALLFVRERARLLLPALPPECVFVTRTGRLRLAGGLAFALPLPPPPAELSGPLPAPHSWALDGRAAAPASGPELAWCAPELVLSRSAAPTSDAFVLALLAHSLLLVAHGGAPPPPRSIRSASDYQQLLREVTAQVAAARANMGPLPAPLADALEPLLARDWAARADVRGLLRAPAWAADVPLQAVLFAAQLQDKPAADQRAFFKGLLEHAVLAQVPAPLLRHVLLPACVTQVRRVATSDPELAAALVACAVQAAAALARASASAPDPRPVDGVLRVLTTAGMLATAEPAAHVALLQHLDALLLASPAVLDATVVPDVLLRALGPTAPKVLDTAVKQLAKNVAQLPIESVRLLLLPRLMALSLASALPPLPRANCLVCAQKLAARMDPTSLHDTVIPPLEQLLQRPDLLTHPGLVMAAFCLLELVGAKAPPELICCRLLPIMLPLLLLPFLSVPQVKQAQGICEALLKQAVQQKIQLAEQPARPAPPPAPVISPPAFHEVVAAAYASKVPPGPSPSLPPVSHPRSNLAFDSSPLPMLAPPPPAGMGLFTIPSVDAGKLPPPLVASTTPSLMPQFTVSPSPPPDRANASSSFAVVRSDVPSSFQTTSWNATPTTDPFADLFFSQPKDTKKQL